MQAYRQLDPTAWPRKGLSPTNLFLAILIVIAVIGAILETEPIVAAGRELLFEEFEVVVAAIFAVEYVARLWTV
ncbi:MAG TPA: hypothetical protein VFU80_03915, partial [Sphingomicrobium sp.]|nr:hypothetical protein [Sphingomicrobium sp.]